MNRPLVGPSPVDDIIVVGSSSRRPKITAIGPAIDCQHSERIIQRSLWLPCIDQGGTGPQSDILLNQESMRFHIRVNVTIQKRTRPNDMAFPACHNRKRQRNCVVASIIESRLRPVRGISDQGPGCLARKSHRHRPIIKPSLVIKIRRVHFTDQGSRILFPGSGNIKIGQATFAIVTITMIRKLLGKARHDTRHQSPSIVVKPNEVSARTQFEIRMEVCRSSNRIIRVIRQNNQILSSPN